jgi:hypothetical protein
LTESLTTLELFENELPDTFLELFSHLSFEANREFHIFPKLPLEIRLEIWRLMIPRGRTVQIEVRRSPIRAREFFILGSHTPTPVVLHVNYESRQESLRHFKVLKYNLRGQPVYFRPELDLIYFHMKNPPLDFPLEFFKCSSYIDGGDTAELESIQNVMFKNFDYSWPTLLGNQYTWWLQNGTYGQKGTHVRTFPNLSFSLDAYRNIADPLNVLEARSRRAAILLPLEESRLGFAKHV